MQRLMRSYEKLDTGCRTLGRAELIASSTSDHRSSDGGACKAGLHIGFVLCRRLVLLLLVGTIIRHLTLRTSRGRMLRRRVRTHRWTRASRRARRSASRLRKRLRTSRCPRRPLRAAHTTRNSWPRLKRTGLRATAASMHARPTDRGPCSERPRNDRLLGRLSQLPQLSKAPSGHDSRIQCIMLSGFLCNNI